MAALGMSRSYPPTVVFFVFCLTVQMFMSYDGGATPASANVIMEAGDFDGVDIGLLGALDKVGMTMTSALWGRLLQNVDAKLILLPSLLLNAVFTMLFSLTLDKSAMFLCKFAMGVTQSLQGVWGTCWVMMWAREEVKTSWLGLGAVAAGVGNGIGQLVAGLGLASGFSYAMAFQVQAVILGLLWLMLMTASSESLSIDGRGKAESHSGERRPSPRPSDTTRGTVELVACSGATGNALDNQARDSFPSDCGIDDARSWARRSRTSEISEIVAHVALVVNQSFNVGRSQVDHHPRLDTIESMSYTRVTPSTSIQLRMLMENQLYFWTVLCISSVFYTLSGIQFYWKLLFCTEWAIDDSLVVTASVVFLGVGGGIGVALGPQLIDRAGGVERSEGKARSLAAIVQMLTLSVVGAIIVGFAMLLNSYWRLKNEYISVGIAWIGCTVIFAAMNATLAGLTGINAGSLVTELRSFGSGVTISTQNMLGYALGPLLPGIVMSFKRWLGWCLGYSAKPSLNLAMATVLFGTLASLASAIRALRAAQRAL